MHKDYLTFQRMVLGLYLDYHRFRSRIRLAVLTSDAINTVISTPLTFSVCTTTVEAFFKISSFVFHTV